MPGTGRRRPPQRSICNVASCRLPQCLLLRRRSRAAVHHLDDAIAASYLMTVSSVRVSPLLSTQVIAIVSPAFAPGTLNCMYGFLATAGPQSSFMTGVAVSAAVTLLMCQPGITLPAEALRWA